jgi:hypothetical protein
MCGRLAERVDPLRIHCRRLHRIGTRGANGYGLRNSSGSSAVCWLTVGPLDQPLKPKGENGSDFGSAIYLSCQMARSTASITSWILMKDSRMFSVSPRSCFSAQASAMPRRCVTSLARAAISF